MSGTPKIFSYSINGNDAVSIVSFSGEMQASASDTLERCQQEILTKKNVRYVIFSFQQVTYIATEVIPAIAQLQRSIRGKPAELRMCSMKMELKEKLGKSGILRAPELAEDLKQALHSIKSTKGKTAP